MFSIIFSIGVYACTNVVQIQSIRPQLWIFRTFILHFICISQKVERKSANKRINRYTLAHMYVCMYAAVLLSDREAFIFGWFACKHDRSQCHLENLYSNGILKYTKKKKILQGVLLRSSLRNCLSEYVERLKMCWSGILN